MARSAEAAGAVIRTDAEVASIDVRGGEVVGVTLADGEQLRAPIVASGAHPKTTILDLAGAEHFPDEVADDMRRYRTRGGSVKINMVLSEAPRYEGVSDSEQGLLERTGVNLCPSIDYLEAAWQDALAGRPAAQPLRRGRAAFGDRRDAHRRRPLGDDDVHPVRAARRRRLARRRPRDLRQDLRRSPRPLRAQRARRDRGARGAGAARPGADLRPPGRLDLPGRAGARPDGLHAAASPSWPTTRRRSPGSTFAAPAPTRAAA